MTLWTTAGERCSAPSLQHPLRVPVLASCAHRDHLIRDVHKRLIERRVVHDRRDVAAVARLHGPVEPQATRVRCADVLTAETPRWNGSLCHMGQSVAGLVGTGRRVATASRACVVVGAERIGGRARRGLTRSL